MNEAALTHVVVCGALMLPTSQIMFYCLTRH